MRKIIGYVMVNGYEMKPVFAPCYSEEDIKVREANRERQKKMAIKRGWVKE